MVHRTLQVLGLLFMASSPVFACLCSIQSVCDGYARAEAVIVGRVESVQASDGVDDGLLSRAGQDVRLTVVKVFKGTFEDSEDSIDIWQPFSMCDMRFFSANIGETYLLYLDINNDTKKYSIKSCSRSGKLSDRETDASWLNNLPGAINRTFMSGVIREQTPRDSNGSIFHRPVEGMSVSLTGVESRLKGKSTGTGSFEFWDLPNGRYMFQAELPDHFVGRGISGRLHKSHEDPNIAVFNVAGPACFEIDHNVTRTTH